MQVDGSITIAAPRALVWQRLNDCAVMQACLPGCERAEETEPGCYRVVVAVKLGPIKARFNLVIEITESEAPERLACRTRGEEGSRASQLTAESEVRLQALSEAETEIVYYSEISLVGRLGKFGLGVMRKKADQLAAAFASNLQAQFTDQGVV